jgi:hypothetical protein
MAPGGPPLAATSASSWRSRERSVAPAAEAEAAGTVIADRATMRKVALAGRLQRIARTLAAPRTVRAGENRPCRLRRVPLNQLTHIVEVVIHEWDADNA